MKTSGHTYRIFKKSYGIVSVVLYHQHCPVSAPIRSAGAVLIKHIVKDKLATSVAPSTINDSETMIGAPAPALTTPDSGSEISGSIVAAIDAFQNSSPVPSSTPPVVDSDSAQQPNLTDEQMAFAIASALSVVSTPDSAAITPEQEQPPKTHHKRHALKKVVIMPNSAESSAVSTARPVKCKRQAERVPPNVEPPTKKIKTMLEPGKQVSAR